MPSQTTGYKATGLKSVDDYKSMDAADDSLNRWKASLGLGNADTAPANGPKVPYLRNILYSASLQCYLFRILGDGSYPFFDEPYTTFGTRHFSRHHECGSIGGAQKEPFDD